MTDEHEIINMLILENAQKEAVGHSGLVPDSNLVTNVKDVSNNNRNIQNGLYILNYNEVQNLSLETPFVIQGNIYNKNDDLICKGIPISKELNNLEALDDVYLRGQYKIRPFLEGSLLRFFYYETKWLISTTRKLDAFHSKWGSLSSFGELFTLYLKAEFNVSLDHFFQTLDKNLNYYFLFTSESVFYVHPSTKSLLRLLFVLDKQHNLFEYQTVLEEGKQFHVLGQPTNTNMEVNELSKAPLENIENKVAKPLKIPLLEHCSYAEAREAFIRGEYLGLVLENEFERYTLFAANYLIKKKLYGNQRFLGQRILEVIPDEDLTQEYAKSFPQAAQYIKIVKNVISKFCKKVHRTYVTRYIQRKFVEVEPAVNYFVKLVHQNFKVQKVPTYLNNVIELFNSQSLESQFILLRKYLPSEIGGK